MISIIRSKVKVIIVNPLVISNIEKTQAVVYIIMFIYVTTSLTTSDSSNFYPLDVFATPVVTITPDKDDDEELEEDGGDNGIEEEAHIEAIQPASNTEKQDQSIQDRESDYQIVIPDGAAWEETISERFFPQEVTVPSGSFVSWVNEDDLTHTITSGKKAGYGMYEFLQDGVFNSGDLVEGDSFTFHFSEPGRYEYFCIPHPWMHGVVIVK
jgi:plastocyanin